jgi:hypothetical protein
MEELKMSDRDKQKKPGQQRIQPGENKKDKERQRNK